MSPPKIPHSYEADKYILHKFLQCVEEWKTNEWKQKAYSIVDEYLVIRNIEESIAHLKECSHQTSKYFFVEHSVRYVLRQSANDRIQTGLLLAKLVCRDVVSVPEYVTGLHAVLKDAGYLAANTTHFWGHFGEILSSLLVESPSLIAKLPEICQPGNQYGEAGALVAASLNQASKQLGQSAVSEMWNSAGMKWSDFLAEDEDEVDFIKLHKLEYTIATGGGQHEGATSPTRKRSLRVLMKQLCSILTEGKTNDSVMDWISENIKAEKHSHPAFIKGLSLAVAKSSLTEGGTSVNEESFSSRMLLLQCYIQNIPELELSALFALETLVEHLQHPQGLLSNMLTCIAEHEQMVISDSSLFAWQKQSRNGVAIMSVKHFFEWLKDSIDE